MKKGMTIQAMIILMFLTPLLCFAEEIPVRASFFKPFMKLGRGAINLISSPCELPNHMYLLSKHAYENSPYGIETASAALEGFCTGSVYTFWRLGAGMYDLLTFPFPKYEFSLITPTYFTVSYKKYYEREKKKEPKIRKEEEKEKQEKEELEEKE